ncbi:MAG: DUF4252 domain-containing protein [Massilibacteroides sp.]|nr:DUF4252 domain-containing protein [Massilibacteroides sp.]MDD3063722.1 DUF4252 domain-containing protein [Massilibacteroides sp.]MDD4115051.1 DUF4252 domain-containing protein [Massilibacteroides sp.]MDD4659671.1 DUF4252 domain-containing protein [Massilibacteroides sp.]
MKLKYVWIVVLIWSTQISYGQKNMNQLFDKFAKVENVSHMTMGNFSIKLAGLFTDVMGVDGIEVLSLDECRKEVKTDFISAVKNLKDNGFETMVTSNEGNSRTRVLVRIDEDIIRELVVLTTGDSNALVRIKGKIKPSDIEALVNKHKNG